MIESFAHKQARLLAKKLLAEAEENEPQITADLQKIASEISAELVGLENKFKSKKSLIRKLIDKADFNSRSVKETAETVNDVLRYTFILSFENYAVSFRKTIEKLKSLDYEIPERLIWNAWQTAGKRFDKGYRGINITVIFSQNRKFELQFHTKESYDLKNKTHFLYRKLRGGKISREQKTKITRTLKKWLIM